MSISAVDASQLPGRLGAAYADYMSEFNKDYRSTTEMATHAANWADANDRINRINALNSASYSSGGDTLRLRHNFSSDMSTEEYHQHLGRSQQSSSGGRGQTRGGVRGGQSSDSGMSWNDADHTLGDHHGVNHVTSGVMGPVKDQGACGSCYAFAALSALEAAISIKTGEPPVRLSEQEQVDCSNNFYGTQYGNWGCSGGLEYNTWDYVRDNGSFTNADYPYNGNENNCDRQQVDPRVTVSPGEVTGWNRLQRSVAEIIDHLDEKPLSIGIDADCDEFRWYGSGIISADKCQVTNDYMNHAVVIVGYDMGTTQLQSRQAMVPKVAKWWFYEEDDGNPTPDPDPSPEPEPTPDPDPEPEPQPTSEAYYLIQNSWATSWGENGFVRFGMAEGRGVACMNCDVTYPILSTV